MAIAATVWGLVVAGHYWRAGLTLSHYDARGHLIVARRIIDSLTPGWQQIGAVWLPLPHVLNALPVQYDVAYRTGASAVLLSVVASAVATTALAALVRRVTGTWSAAAAAAAVFACNPNVAYLQATPMTEPLLLGLTVAGVALLATWLEAPDAAWGETSHAQRAAASGATFALACLTRYEAWPVTATAVGLAAVTLWRRRRSVAEIWRRLLPVAWPPVAAALGFSVFSRVVIGDWFASGFFVPENPAEGHPVQALWQIGWGMDSLGGRTLLMASAAGAVVVLGRWWRARGRSVSVLPLALFATAAVPWSAFTDGHPYRIRYMVPLIAAQAACAAALVSLPRQVWLRWTLAAGLVLAVLWQVPPLSPTAPMVLEAQWDRPNDAPRSAITAYLTAHYAGDTIMASMGSLGHYMQQLGAHGFPLSTFLHEGNGDTWLNALDDPRPFAGWVLVEEKAEGGDMLATLARRRPAFLQGYRRVAEGAGLALYARDPVPTTATAR